MERRHPEELLALVQEQERQEKRGKLKIFLGAAPGVGKTYTMLEAACEKREEGLDVIAGLVETHGREETEELLQGLEVFPRQVVEYRGHTLLEFDLDGVLQRHPTLVLVDEMAHTNVPGSRHPKRWQDIKELLDRGINVYTTINVQHIESLNNVVAQITGIAVRETVPDSMLELAYSIELVDLPPDDLLKRLEEGKVYLYNQAELASKNFFRKGNLIALRELALRITAEQVNTQVLLHRRGESIKQIWPTVEKLLVCVGPESTSAKLIRTTFRMAKSLHAEWIALFIDAPRLHLSTQQRAKAIRNLRLAEQLGGESVTINGRDVIKEIIAFARSRNVTKIIIGKQMKPRWKDWLYRSLVDELLKYSGDIDLYIIHSEHRKNKWQFLPTINRAPWTTFLFSGITVAICTGINYLLFRHLAPSNLIMIYLLGIVIVAARGYLLPAMLASLLSVLAFDFFFVPPRFSFSVNDSEYLITFGVMLLVAQVISQLTVMNQRQVEATRLREQRTTTLHVLSRQLASSRGLDRLLQVGVKYLSEVFASEVLALLPDQNGQLVIRTGYHAELTLNPKEQSVAQWVYDLGQIAGLGTETLPYAQALYIPLMGSAGPIGTLRILPKDPSQLFNPEQLHLLESLAHQIALSLEVDMLQEQAKRSEVQIAADRLRRALLQSVSHDLRAPLIAIMGSASSLIEMGNNLERTAIKKLAYQIYDESGQLNRLINNLLQITYLEAETVTLQKEFHNLRDVINTSLNTLGKSLGKREIHLDIPADLPKVPVDRVLIQEVIDNLLDNAIKFTPPNTAIDISAARIKDKIVISIGDYGPGLTSDEVKKIFDKFYQGQILATARGLGLGLAICRNIIIAHGGEIWAENRSEGGAIFRFTLPIK